MRHLRWNLTWFLPLAVGLLVLSWLNLSNGYHNSLILLHHRTWAFLLSPSAAIWLVVNIIQVSAPVQALRIIPGLFDPSWKGYGRRYWWLAGGMAVFASVMAAAQVLDWGSFPLVKGAGGELYMRMIPFL